jgi:hypothetical protein
MNVVCQDIMILIFFGGSILLITITALFDACNAIWILELLQRLDENIGHFILHKVPKLIIYRLNEFIIK